VPAVASQSASPSTSLASETIARWQAMKSNRKNWDILWDDCARYIAPRKGNILTKYTPGQNQTINIYDTTATEALNVFAAGLLSHIVPAGEKWFRFEPKSKNPSPALKEWLDEVSDITIDAIYSSNFYLAIHEDFLDAGQFCSSCLLIEEGKKFKLNYINVPVGTFAIDEDSEGMVDTVAREWKWSARQAQQKWGTEALGRMVQEALRSNIPSDSNKLFTFIHFVEPRQDAHYKGGPAAPWMRPYRSIYVCVEDQHVIAQNGMEEGGYYEMPYPVSRLLRSNNEIYGRGPGIDTLPEIKLVNAMERDLLTGVEKMVNPPWLMPDDTSYLPDNRPNGITYWDTGTGTLGKPEQMELKNRIDLGEQKTEQKRTRIKQAFYNPMFQMLSNMEEQKREKTAYEVQQMVAEKLNLFSPLFARMVVEKLTPILERTFGILARGGAYPAIPADLEHDGEYEIVYTSKIALAIKAAENQAFATMVQIIEQIAPLDPSVVNMFRWRDGLRRLARNVGMPAKLLNDDRTVDQMTADQQKAAAAQQQAQTAELMTRSAKNLGPQAQQQATERLPQAAAAMR
jgi:hypothetical protein